MEVSDILKVTYELFRVKEDRFIMGWEDDRAKLFRAIDTAHNRIAKLTNRFKVLKDSYDQLHETVKLSEERNSSARRTNNSVDSELNSPTKKRSEKSLKRKHAAELNEEYEVIGRHTDKAISEVMKPAESANKLVMVEKNSFKTSDNNDTKLKEETTSTKLYGNNENSRITNVNTVGDGFVRGNKVLKKHQSCIELPSESLASRVGGVQQKQPQLQIAPKSGKSLHRSVTSYDRSSAQYKCVDVVRSKAGRDALPGHTCSECAAFYEAMEQQGVFSPNSKKARLQQCSRHKAKWTPPRTPEGFWDLTVHTPEEWK